MTDINYAKRFVEFLSNKAQSGSATPAEFNLAMDRSQMQKYQSDYEKFLVTGDPSDFLSTFLKKTTLTIDSQGEANYPSDYLHSASMRSFYAHPKNGSVQVQVKEEKILDWGLLQTSQLFCGTKRYPKYSHFSNKLRFLPRDLGLAYFDYFATPVKPIWGYTLDSFNNEIYDPTTSIHFEWAEVYLNEIAGIYLSQIGVNLKDGEISQFAELFKAQNK